MKKLQFFGIHNLEHVAAMVQALEAASDLTVIQEDQHGYVTDAGHLMAGSDAISACHQGDPVFRALKKTDAADAWIVMALPGLLEVEKDSPPPDDSPSPDTVAIESDTWAGVLAQADKLRT